MKMIHNILIATNIPTPQKKRIGTNTSFPSAQTRYFLGGNMFFLFWIMLRQTYRIRKI